MAPPTKPTITLEQRITNIERLLKWLGGFSGISLIVLLAFAYWLGGISTKVSISEETLKKLAEDVSGKEGLVVKTSLLDHKVGSIDTRLSTMDSKLDTIKNQTLRERTTVLVKPRRPLSAASPTP